MMGEDRWKNKNEIIWLNVWRIQDYFVTLRSEVGKHKKLNIKD
jgi:hypothetical protein